MLRKFDRVRSVLVFVVAVNLTLSSAVFAQEGEPPQAKPAEGADNKDSAIAEYQAKLEEWKSILRELRTLQSEFGKAEEEALPEIRRRWEDLMAKGEAFMSELSLAGQKAYAAAPQEDRELERLLASILADDVKHDRYEEASELSKILLENGCDIKEVHDAGGVAAFATNHFDHAEIYLKRAEQEGALSEKGGEFLSAVTEHKTLWEDEKKLRDKEEQENLPRVRISTNKGDMVAELYENEAPETVANFISLVEKGFYNGLTFHRVLPQFMVQGGCPLGDGTGGPGYTIFCECYKDDYRKHFRGTLSMAHSGRDTGGSQFFITFVPTPFLNGRHTAFGRVIEGLDVLAKIQRIDPEDASSKPEPDKILKMEVVRKRDHEYQPNKVN